MRSSSSPRKRWVSATGAFLAATLILGACGGGSDNGADKPKSEDSSKPVYGGKLVYALEAESADGWCLPEAQLAIAGIQVARTIYDTLTAPNVDGDYVPFLAESVTPNADFTEWTIKVREGVKFHNGTALDATVVKNNLDAYRGTYPARNPLLFRFVYSNIKDVAVKDPLSVTVTMNSPWSAFPAALYGSGRIGIMAQEQLDDPDTCDTKLIGTGPFSLVEWAQNDHLLTKKNPDYWGTDADGGKLPYLDEVEYRPIIEASSRTNALLGGDINALHTATPEQIDALRNAADEGKVTNLESDKFAEVTFGQLNNSKEPFNNKNARLAVISALDVETFNESRNLGINQIANGPFAPGNMGYLKDTGYPKFDLEKAKGYAAAYKKETGKDLAFTLISTPDAATKASAQLAQQMAEKANIKVTLTDMEQAALISTAISGDFDAMVFRNYPGGDPDSNYNWWKSDSPVNFSKFNDPDIDRLLDEGRHTDDKAKRTTIYEDVNKRFGEEGYSMWLYWVIWDISTAPEVHGVLGPKLPDGSEPFPGLAVGNPVSGMWIDQ
ncbi:MAG: ABC transporter substrate-binding protein [Microthrixaceae bacterium]